MPIINFTTADILRQKLIDEGWYGVKITAINGPKAAKTGNGVNFEVDFTLDDKSPAPGKVVTRVFNSSLISMMIPLVAACRGVSVEDIKENFSLDTTELLGKDIDVKLIKDLYEGRWNNKAEGGFLPKGMGTNQTVPF